MIKNFECKSLYNAQGEAVFNLKWEWVLNDSGILPSLSVLYRTIPEDEILENSLFDKDSVVLYMSKEISRNGIDNCIKNTARYKIKNYSLSPNGAIFFEKDLEIAEFDCIYFFCMLDASRNIFDRWVRKTVGSGKVDFEIKSPLFQLGRNRQRTISIKEESRRIILRTGSGGNFSYSLLPFGHQKYYIAQNMPNFKLIYLSDLINI